MLQAIAAGSPLWEVYDGSEYDQSEDESDETDEADAPMPSAEGAGTLDCGATQAVPGLM